MKRRRAQRRILITGGTGFIGGRLTRRALAQGWVVSVLTRKPQAPAARALALAGARLLLGDVTDRGSVRAALEVTRPEIVFHIAGWYELGIPRRARRRMRAVNVDAVETVLSLAAEGGVERVVAVSSTTAIGDTGGEVVGETFRRNAPPTSWYETTKAEAHELALRHQRSGEPVVIAAPAQVIGPGDHSPFGIMARLFLHRRLPPVAWGPDGAFSFVHVDDVAEALLILGERGRIGELYFLAGQPMTVGELMNVWRELEGRTPVRMWLPRPLALALAAPLSPLLRLVRLPAFLSPEAVRSGYASFRYSSEKAVNELGVTFRPAAAAWADTFRGERDLSLARPGEATR